MGKQPKTALILKVIRLHPRSRYQARSLITRSQFTSKFRARLLVRPTRCPPRRNKVTDEAKESAIDQWRRERETTSNPTHWKKPRKNRDRPTVGETVNEIKRRQEQEKKQP